MPHSSSDRTIRPLLSLIALAGALGPAFGPPARAQSPESHLQMAVLGAVPNGVGQLFGTHFPAPLLGAALGLRLGDGAIRVRPTLRVAGSLPTDSDPTLLRSTCWSPGAGDAPCRVEPAFAQWYVSPGIDILLAPSPRARLYASLGAGWSWLPGRALRPGGGVTSAPLPAGRCFGRVALGLRLWGGTRAPRLELGVTQFAPRAGAARNLLGAEVRVR